MMSTRPQPPPRPPQPCAYWKPSPNDFANIFFFYGATFSELNRSIIGVIARDRNGLVLTSLLPQLPQVHSLEDIEALAASKALPFAAEIEIE